MTEDLFRSRIAELKADLRESRIKIEALEKECKKEYAKYCILQEKNCDLRVEVATLSEQCRTLSDAQSMEYYLFARSEREKAELRDKTAKAKTGH